MVVSEMSPEETQRLETWRREHVCFESLGVDHHAKLLMAAFLPSGRPWSRRALGEYLSVPRSTLLRKLRGLEDRGMVSQQGERWQVTPEGRRVGRALLVESGQIVTGDRIGFSSDTLSAMKRAGFDVRPAAAHLSFPPLPKHKRVRGGGPNRTPANVANRDKGA